MISPTDGPSKVGIFVGHHETMTNASTDALNHFTALPALTDATGLGGYTIYAEPSVMWTAYITKDCAYPAAAMKFLDTFYLDETMTRQRHGEKDVDWLYEEGTNAYGTQSYAKAVNSEAFFSGKSTWSLNTLGIMTHWNYLLIAQEGEGRIAQASRLQTEQWDIFQNGKRPEEEAVNLVYSAEEYEIREDKASTVNNYITTEVNYFVSGEKDASDDAVWNEFLSTMKSIGREELMKVCQDAYNRQ
jgi:putative aldouronate transport system substrate-binding protein